MRAATTPDADALLERWLAGGLGAGAIVDVQGVWVDLVGLAERRFACLPERCTPGMRQRGVLSCCADLDVTLTAAERRRIDARLGPVTERMAARDRRWAGGPPQIYADPSLRAPVLARSARRCIFAYQGAAGLLCGLHTAAEELGLPVAELKPEPCRMFPLVLLRCGGRSVLTATHGEVSRALGGPPEKRLACIQPLHEKTLPRLFESCRDIIEQRFGRAFYRRLVVVARGWASRAES